jgi:hypothetical protein
MYQQGLGTAKDSAQAFAWYSKAAQQGIAPAEDNLGLMYCKGLGTERDYVQALTWFSKAAQQGSATAESNLGYMYLKGLGVPQDPATARIWFEKAAGQGNDDARRWLSSMARETTNPLDNATASSGDSTWPSSPADDTRTASRETASDAGGEQQ